MTFSESRQDGVTVLALAGDALGGPDGTRLHDRIVALRQEGSAPHVVLDLAGVDHMNSSGLGMLIGALTTARGAGGDLRLASVPPRVQSLLAVTRLTDVLVAHPTPEAAVASFA